MTLIAIPVFPRFTALDAVGPYEVLQRIPSMDVVFVGHRRGEQGGDAEGERGGGDHLGAEIFGDLHTG